MLNISTNLFYQVCCQFYKKMKIAWNEKTSRTKKIVGEKKGKFLYALFWMKKGHLIKWKGKKH